MESDNRMPEKAFALPDWSAERQYLGRFYLSQGFQGERDITNDCGPTSLAMVLNMLIFQANPGTSQIGKNAIIRSSGLMFWDRLPGWMPKVGGATAPWGLVKAFNHWAEKMGLDWRAERKSRARRAHILENLMTGKPVTALKIWKNRGAHWINMVRYSAEKDRVYFLDPNPYLEYLPEEKRIQSQSWQEFETDWSRRNWWAVLLGIRNELVLYTRRN